MSGFLDAHALLCSQETATLADRLIQDQVICAQKEEEIFVLRRELATVRQHDVTATEHLTRLQQQFTEFKERVSLLFYVLATSNIIGGELAQLVKELRWWHW